MESNDQNNADDSVKGPKYELKFQDGLDCKKFVDAMNSLFTGPLSDSADHEGINRAKELSFIIQNFGNKQVTIQDKKQIDEIIREATNNYELFNKNDFIEYITNISSEF